MVEHLIRPILLKNTAQLMKKKGVVIVGQGYKIVNGFQTERNCIVVSVAKKKPLKEIKKKDLVPREIDAIPTDVIETGVIKALHTQRHRPAMGGISIGEKSITAGTLGCLVKKGHEVFILSNNHVLACSNEAEIGADIIQPGSYDGGNFPEDHIAELADFVPISFTGGSSECPIGDFFVVMLNSMAKLVGSHTRLKAICAQEGVNLVDAAIARPLDPDWVLSTIMEIGKIVGTKRAELGMPIQKSGRTTGLTLDSVSQVDATVQVQYGEGKIATFSDQFIGGPMSAGGDSGSAVLSMDNELAGLLFAGSETVTICNHIGNVFDLLNVELCV